MNSEKKKKKKKKKTTLQLMGTENNDTVCTGYILNVKVVDGLTSS